MQLKDMKNDIDEGKLKRLYLVHGRESYIVDEILKMLKNSLMPSLLDFNFKVIEGDLADSQAIVESCETLPLMDERRITVVKDLPVLRSGKNSWTDAQEDALAEYIAKIPESSVLVFLLYQDVDKRKKLVKQIIKAAAEIVCDKLKGSELIGWVKRAFESRGMSISHSELIYFIKICDYEGKNSQKTLSDVENDIIKISSYLSEGTAVGKDVIDKLSSTNLENDIFRLIDCIGTRKGAQAVKLLSDMMLQGTPAIMVLSMIGKQFRIMLQVKELNDLGYSQPAMAKKIDAHQFVVKKALSEGRGFNAAQLKDILCECSRIDHMIKTGLIEDRIGVEILISALSAEK